MAGWAAAISAAGSIVGGLLKSKGSKKSAKLQKKALQYQIFADQQARNDLAPFRQSGYGALNALNRAMGLQQQAVPQDQNLSVQQIYSGQYGSMGAPPQYAPARMTAEVQQYLRDQGYNIPDEMVGPAYAESGQPVTGDDRYGGFYASPGYQFRMDEGINALDKSAAARGRLRSGAQNKALTRYGQGLASEEFGNYTNRLAQIAGLGGNATSQGVNIGIQGAANIGNAMANIGATRQSGYDMWGRTAANLGNVFGDAYLRSRNNSANNATDDYLRRVKAF